jgi:hypothetical protein
MHQNQDNHVLVAIIQNRKAEFSVLFLVLHLTRELIVTRTSYQMACLISQLNISSI